MAKKSGHFVFRKHDSIGANDAYDDREFLKDCFADIGDLAVIEDCSKPECIVVGRTGVGKTALLLKIAEQHSDFVIDCKPEELSLNYIANSTILQYLSQLDVNLDPFFKLLWRHLFAVSIFQERFAITDADSQRKFVDSVLEIFDSHETKEKRRRKKASREKVLAYINDWGDKFFQDVGYRTKALTDKFTSIVSDDVEANIGTTLHDVAKAGFSAGRSGSSTMESQVETDVEERARYVVNSVLVKELTGILELVDELLDDSQKPCYILIDRLDEDWVDDSLRYRLLKGLVDTAKEFGKEVRNAKVIVSLRQDVLERLFRECRSDAGFQEDKYRSLYLRISWTSEQLTKMLNQRVTKLVRDRYTNANVGLSDIMPSKVNGQNPVTYFLSRTWKRPRDLIDFFNECIKRVEGKARFTQSVIADAEGEYSRHRLRAIAEEWHRDYPQLPGWIKVFLARQNYRFRLGDLQSKDVTDWILNIAVSEGVGSSDNAQRIHVICQECANENLDEIDVIKELVDVFFRVGAVGVKPISFESYLWAQHLGKNVSPAELDAETSVEIHPALWRVLGVQLPSR